MRQLASSTLLLGTMWERRSSVISATRLGTVIFVLALSILSICDAQVQSSFSSHLGIYTPLTMNGHSGFLLAPKMQIQRERNWIWYAPTLLGKDTPSNVNKYMFDQLLNQGIWIAGIDVGESYGSPAGTAQYASFYELMVNNYGLARMPCLLVQSRGGLMLYKWAEEHPGAVRCIGGIFPVTDLRSWPLEKNTGVYEASPKQFAEARAAYGVKAVQEFRDRLEEFSPITHLAPLATHKIPLMHIHGDSDKWVPALANSCELLKRYTALGGDAVVKIIKGRGHEPAPEFFQSCDLLAFFFSHLRPDLSFPQCQPVDFGKC